MNATILILSELEVDAVEYARHLADVGFTDIHHSTGDPLRDYLDRRPDVVVLDLLSDEEERALLRRFRVGAWHNVAVPVVVVGEDAAGYLEAGAEAVVPPAQVSDVLGAAVMAVYSERSRKVVELGRRGHANDDRLAAIRA